MQKEIKKIIENHLYGCCKGSSEWEALIIEYYHTIKGSEKGVVLKYRYFEKKPFWSCLTELKRNKFYCGKDNFYRLASEVINDIALRAVWNNLINPYEFQGVKYEK